MTKTRYQRGSIRTRGNTVFGEFRGEPVNGKRPHISVTLGTTSDVILKGTVERRLTKADWRDRLRPRIEEYYAKLGAPKGVHAEMTLRQFVETAYLPAHESGWAKTSQRSLKSNLKVNILKQIGHLPLVSIQKAIIVQRLNEMRAAGKAKRTLATTKWLLSQIFEEAIDNDLIEKTPMRRLNVLKNMPGGEETRPLTVEEVRTIYASTDGIVRLMWRVMIGCGLRPGELVALRRNDIGETQLRIDEALELGEFGPTKTRRVRWQPLPSSLREELREWLKGIEASQKALLFTRPDGQLFSQDSLNSLMQNVTRERTGIKDLTLRMARTTFGTLLSGDIKDVQDLMGHSTPQTTLKHYKKAINSRQVETVEELDQRLTKASLKVISGGRK